MWPISDPIAAIGPPIALDGQNLGPDTFFRVGQWCYCGVVRRMYFYPYGRKLLPEHFAAFNRIIGRIRAE